MTKHPLRNGLLAMFAAAVLAACGGGGDASGPAPLPPSPSPAAGILGDGRLPELVEWARASQNAPAMGVIVIRGGQVAERAVVGRRSMDGGPAATVDDRWHLGSITKSMTSTLAATMVEDGLIGWDTTPLEVWPELGNEIHADYRNVTLRHFLSHTSGMKRDDAWSGSEDSASGTLVQKRREWAERMLSRPAEFSTGTFSYSNIGYVVAGAMLETRAGAPWEELLTTRVLTPLGMVHTGFGAPGTHGQVDQPLGHWSRNSGFDPVPVGPGDDNPKSMGPAGTAHTTLDDFAAYLQAHLAGEQGVGGLVSAQSFATLHAPVASNYALGWGAAPDLSPLGAGGNIHNGSNLRWFAVTWFSAQKDAGLLIVLNGGGERAEAAIGALDLLLRERIAATPQTSGRLK
ncbi:MAG TPA: serine hydrolase domain-containing protein [Steroidobacteraceae bacterium]|nr:serine hydrolase domain-containing protein [Steroidobacteraceae bacterium]